VHASREPAPRRKNPPLPFKQAEPVSQNSTAYAEQTSRSTYF